VQITIGWVILVLGGLLYLAQVISSVNFEFAQRLGIQENPRETDSILQTYERFTAYWDLVTLGWLPLSGLLMIIDNTWWPIAALVGGAIYLDTSGREAVKILSLRKEDFKLGTKGQQRIFFGSYIVMAIIGIVVIGYSIKKLVSV
jgi:hypothetical protein